MEIKRQDAGRLRVVLNSRDLERLGISYESLDYIDPASRQALGKVLEQAQRETGFSPGEERMLIEASPGEDGGCILVFTLLGGVSRCRRQIYSFDGADPFFDALHCLGRQYGHRIFGSSAYRLGERYYLSLLPLDGEQGQTLAFLREYGRQEEGAESSVFESYLAEHGQCLAGEDAVERLGGPIRP